MNIHFLPDSIYTNTFIKYIHENYKENKFFLITNQKLKYITESVQIINGNTIEIIKNIYKVTKEFDNTHIYLHFLSDYFLFPILFASKKQKTYWIVWGADLYNNINFSLYEKDTKKFVKKKRKTIKSLILLVIRKIAIRKVNFIGINEVEYRIIKKHFLTKAKRVNFKYPNPISEISQKIVCEQQKNKKIILLGNSGDPTNNHVSMINKLAAIKKDFFIIVPLSYGNNKEYIDYVLKLGKEKLDNRFIPLLEIMSTNEYGKLLSTVDIAIMNHYRQQAAGNLRILLSEGKKVYLNSTNPLYEYYTQEGIQLEKLDNCIFSDDFFKPYNKEIQVKNKLALERIYSEETIKSYMDDLFK